MSIRSLVTGVLRAFGFPRETRDYRPSDPTWALARLVDGSEKLTKPYLQHPWVYAAIKSIATNVASTPLLVNTGSADNTRTIETGPLYDVLTRPNSLWTRWHLIEATASHLQSDGNAIWALKRKSPKQVPVEILCFGRAGWEATLNDNNAIASYRYREGDQDVTFQPHEVVHFRLWNPESPVWGIGPLQAALMSAKSDYDAAVYNRAFFQNSAMPGGIIEMPEGQSIDDRQWQQLSRRWNDLHQGSRKAFKLGVLEGGAKYTQVSLSHRDMMFLEMRKWSREEILACFRVPPSEVGVFELIHKAVGGDIRKAYWEQTLVPLMRLIEDTLRAQFFQPLDNEKTWCEFDLSNVSALQDSEDVKLDRAVKLFGMGYPPNVINERLQLGLPEIEGGDTGYLPMGLMPIGSEPPEPEPPPALPPPDEPKPDESKPDEDEDEEKAALDAVTRDAIVYSLAQIEEWKSFVRTVAPGERRMQEDVRKYLARVKKWLAEQLGKHASPADIPIDALMLAADWDDDLKSLAAENYRRVAAAMKPKVESRLKRLGVDFNLNLSDPRLEDFMRLKTLKVVQINDTIRDGLRDTLQQAQADNLTMSELQEEIFAVMQDSRARALRIARTETASAANGTEYVAHNIAGIQKHMWLAAMDENTRDSHAMCMRQGSIEVGKTFANGLRFPGDPQGGPEEVCNCRCSLIPTQ